MPDSHDIYFPLNDIPQDEEDLIPEELPERWKRFFEHVEDDQPLPF